MNVTKSISLLILTAAVACAQSTTTTTKKPAMPAVPSTAKPASQAAPAAKAPVAKAAPKTTAAAKKPAKAAAAPKAAAPKAVAPKAVAKTSKPAKPAMAAKQMPAKSATPAQKAANVSKPIGKRDPFVSVIVARSDNSASCSGGKRCLIVDQLALRGIVRTPTKWIALVENPAKKTYYLYENDPIFNATVVRITGDSVIFREQIMDALGHMTEREVVKRVSAPAI